MPAFMVVLLRSLESILIGRVRRVSVTVSASFLLIVEYKFSIRANRAKCLDICFWICITLMKISGFIANKRCKKIQVK